MHNKFKKIFLLIVLMLNITLLNSKCYASNTPSNWAKEEVQGAINLNLVPTNIQNNYQSNISRTDFCDLAIRLIEVYSSNSIDNILKNNNVNEYKNPFIEKNLSNNVIACYELGIVSGDDTNHFRPNDNITRQEAAKILTVLTNIFGELKDKELINFEDQNEIQNWAKSYVDFVVLKGIINGVKNGNKIYFNPKGGYTREQAILTIYRLYNSVTFLDKNLVGNIENFITNRLEGLDNELKIFNYQFDKSKEIYNYVNVKITTNDYEFKLQMTDKNNNVAEINVIGNYNSLCAIELDGNSNENELYLKYFDSHEKEYVKILRYQGDHFDELLTLVNIEYFGSNIKADGNGKIFGVFHTFLDGTINGYYDINKVYNIERIINKNKEGTATIKEEMIGAVTVYNGKETVITKDLKDKLGLNIGDSVKISHLYDTKNYVTITTKTNDTLKVVVTK